MKHYPITIVAVLAAVVLIRSSSTAEIPPSAKAVEYATIRWDGRDNTSVILPNGSIDFVGPKLKAIRRPDRVDERAFYMNVVMNSLAQDGFEVAGMGGDANVIVMKRSLQAGH